MALFQVIFALAGPVAPLVCGSRIEHTVDVSDDVRRDFGRNPKGWQDFARLCVARLADVLNVGIVALPDLSEIATARAAVHYVRDA